MTRPLSLAAELVPVVLVAALVLGAGLNRYPAWEPWHLAAAMLDPGYLRELYVSQHWERVVDAGHSMHARSALFYVPVLLALLAEHALVFAVHESRAHAAAGSIRTVRAVARRTASRALRVATSPSKP